MRRIAYVFLIFIYLLTWPVPRGAVAEPTPIVVPAATPIPTATPTPTQVPTPTPDPFVLQDVPLDAALQRYIFELCEEYNISNLLVLAMIQVESYFTPDLISVTDDYGLMQINTCNHKWLSNKLGIVDFLDPEQNILAGAYLISEYLHEFEDVHKALMVYNMGRAGAARAWRRGVTETSYSNRIYNIYTILLSNNIII